LQRIRNDLKGIGYNTNWTPRVLDASDFCVPQKRERIYVVAFDEDRDFSFPKGNGLRVPVASILELEVASKYYLSQKYLDGLKRHRERQKEKGRGFGFEILDKSKPSNTIVCGGMGHERNLVVDNEIPADYPADRNSEHVRKMTPREWALLQGFPPGFVLHENDRTAYRQLGNSVAVPVIRAVAEAIARALDAPPGMSFGLLREGA
jgi:DNA (cytosine-5)-methyltransferase 1